MLPWLKQVAERLQQPSLTKKEKAAILKISQANNAFTFDMYKILAEEPGNFFFSPLSIQVIFALTFQGARDNTAKQIASALHLPDDRAVIEDGVRAIMKTLKGNNYFQLDIASKMFLKAGIVDKEEFIQSAARLKAGLEEVDFLQETQTRETINDWVEKKTNNKIKDIIAPGVFNELTRMVLVNAIYFKGEWLQKFDKSCTLLSPFNSASGAAKNVLMMDISAEFKYTESNELNSQVLLLPYKGERLSMMIFLPREVNGLTSLEERLPNFNLQDTINKMNMTLVMVHFPKFKLEYSKELKEALTRLGMTDMFDDDASNFTGISDQPLKVDNVFHKAFVEVNEEKTEAAAVTVGHGRFALSADYRPPPPTVFKADRPFVFLILDEETKSVLFAGRFSDPPSTY